MTCNSNPTYDINNINTKNKYGYTPLMEECHKSADLISATEIQNLINIGADVNMVDNDGRSVLINACVNHTITLDIVKLLIDNGADCHFKGLGWNPLAYAC